MNKSLKTSNILANILKFLSNNEIILFSMINKNIYTLLLNPIHNTYVNSLHREFAYKKYYLNELSEEEEREKSEEKPLDNYELTKNNWKLIYRNLHNNYNNYPNKDIVKLIYNCFKIHLYLPGLRKSNKYLEFKFNSLHQLISYDISLCNSIIYNHYDKYINENGFISEKTKTNDFMLKKTLHFENEFLNFNQLLNIVKNDINLKTILEKISNYDYTYLDYIYINNNIDVNNNIFIFILWLNHTIIYFAEFIYRYVNIYAFSNNNQNNEKKLLTEFINKHNDFVNFSLLINERLNNINLIINYLKKFILTKNNDNNDNNGKKVFNYFSIYKLCINIMKKEFYDKLKNKIKTNFEIITNQYINDLFDNSNNENNDNNDSKTKEDSNSFEEDENNFDEENFDCSLLDENNELTNKELVEKIFLCITDLNINEYNSNLINHSELIMNDDYKAYENILIKAFTNKINKCLEEEKNINELFIIIKKALSSQNDDIDNISKDNEISLNIIKRSKKIIFFKIINFIKDNIIKKIKEDCLKYIQKNNNIDINNKNNNAFLIGKNIILSGEEKNKINEEEKIMVANLYINEIEKIKKDLKQIIKDKNNDELINYYFDYSNCYFACVLKEILCYFYMENEYFSKMDNKIVNILTKGNNNYPSSFISKPM